MMMLTQTLQPVRHRTLGAISRTLDRHIEIRLIFNHHILCAHQLESDTTALVAATARLIDVGTTDIDSANVRI